MASSDHVIHPAASEIPSHVVGEVLDNSRGGDIEGLEVLDEKRLMKAKDTLQLHPEGELEVGGGSRRHDESGNEEDGKVKTARSRR